MPLCGKHNFIEEGNILMKRNIKFAIATVLTTIICALSAGCSRKDDNGVYVDKNGNISIDEDKFENHVNSVFGGNNNSAPESSMPEPKPIDPFENLEVVFTGIAPNVTAELNGNNSYVSYSLDRNRELKNGDKITVTAEIPSYKADDYVLTSDSKDFTVSNRPYYIMELSELTEDDVRKLGDTITSLVSDDIIAHPAGGSGSTVNSLDFLGNINLTKNNCNYRLYFVYKANVTFAKIGETKEYFFSAYYENVYKENDGTIVFSDGRPSYSSNGDMSMSLKGFYVGGAYASVDSLNSQISGFGAEKESNIKV